MLDINEFRTSAKSYFQRNPKFKCLNIPLYKYINLQFMLSRDLRRHAAENITFHNLLVCNNYNIYSEQDSYFSTDLGLEMDDLISFLALIGKKPHRMWLLVSPLSDELKDSYR